MSTDVIAAKIASIEQRDGKVQGRILLVEGREPRRRREHGAPESFARTVLANPWGGTGVPGPAAEDSTGMHTFG
ncbi:MAG: hypothetical protein J2P32_01150 [Actinobacteria bacterium]|nr:hypothetical protein [Actinomycetota bacterium]